MLVKRCPHCMADLKEYDDGPCPVCGFDQDAVPQPEEAMPRNTILHGKYLVGDVLGQGGFGITYIGFDLSLEIKVAIKEYYPTGAVSRREGQSSLVWNSSNLSRGYRQNAYDDFLKEARKMARMDLIPSIVRVRETFLENETAYIVMDYVEGETLKTRLRRDGVMKFSDCLALLHPMMEDLDKVHAQGLIHRDISPDNIMIQPDGKVKLLDLGAAKDLTLQKEGTSQLVTKKGFSPPEQYMDGGKIGPWTDVYALCATIYYVCYGKLTPPALERMFTDDLTFEIAGKEPLPETVTAALKRGLALQPGERTQSVAQLLSELENPGPNSVDAGDQEGKNDRAPISHRETPDDAAEKEQSQKQSWDQSKEKKEKRLVRWKKGAILAATVLLLAGIGAGIYFVVPFDVSEKEIVMAGKSIGTYSGQIVAGQPSGEGTMIFTNGDVYQGMWQDGWREGQGRITYAEGNEAGLAEYDGEWVVGHREGYGKLVYSNGDVYEGEWRLDAQEGQGTMTFSENDSVQRVSYTGGWKNGKRDGQGTMIWQNGEVYEGEWLNGVREGQGTMTFSENDSVERVSYTGGWKDDQREGQGTMTWQNGNVYEGEWLDGMREGQGTMTWPSGNVYEGEWLDGVREGQGTMTWSSGTVYEGEWQNGVQEGQGTMTWPSGDVYEGEWMDGAINGAGVYRWGEGNTPGYWFEGMWTDGKRNGQGIEYKPDGSINRAGEWVNGRYVG